MSQSRHVLSLEHAPYLLFDVYFILMGRLLCITHVQRNSIELIEAYEVVQMEDACDTLRVGFHIYHRTEI